MSTESSATDTSTPAPSPEAAQAAPSPTEAAPPEPKQDPFHRAYGALARKEKALLEQQKGLSVNAKRNADIEAAFALADTDAPGAVEALGALFGKQNLFELAAHAAVSRKKQDPGVTKALSEVDGLRQDLLIERTIPLIAQGASFEQIAEQLGVDAAELAKTAAGKKYMARVEKAQAHYEQQIENTLTRHDQEIRSWVLQEREPDGITPKYELINALSAEDKVFALISEHFEQTLAAGNPVQLSREEAADIIEQELLNYARKLSGVKKLQLEAKLEAPTKLAAAATKHAPTATKRTLSNASAQESSSAAKPMTEAERINQAAKVLQASFRK